MLGGVHGMLYSFPIDKAMGSEGELEHMKRLLIQLPVDNFNMLKYIRYSVVWVLLCGLYIEILVVNSL